MTDVRLATHPHEFQKLNTDELRARFVVDDLFAAGEVRFALSHHDRILIGGAEPAGAQLEIEAPRQIRAAHLCDRRELGIVCLAGTGTVNVDDAAFDVDAEDAVYVGAGSKAISVAGDATFYLVSAPAHRPLPTTLLRRGDAQTATIGDAQHANRRTIRKYVHDAGVQSCELALGITTLEEGSVWNTMPCHTHDRRTEVYMYFDVPEGERIVHLCGQPQATRSLVLADRQAVISPPWSVHTGAGTAAYKFVWSTAGENLAYNDMDPVDTRVLR